ncbi:MAG: phasin family protein [Methylovirgula sp.]|nr:phasin family protein [Methylovirgula sp.]
MTTHFEDFQKLGQEQLETMSAVAGSLAKGFQTIAAETAEYSKRSLETSKSYLEKLAGAKSLDDAVRIQSEYAKTAYEDLIAQTSKISDHYGNLAKEAFKPVEDIIAKSRSERQAA